MDARTAASKIVEPVVGWFKVIISTLITISVGLHANSTRNLYLQLLDGKVLLMIREYS